VNLRPATADDVTAVRALEVDLFGVDAWSEASVREELLGERRTAVVACDPEVVGYVVTAAAGDVVDLQRVAVREDHRRTGLARRLLRAVRPAHVPWLLEVAATNDAALRLYAAEGFTEIDRRRRYYRDGTDAVVMRLAPGGPEPGGRMPT
jgi:ribosomal-protein-alanine N-acetyltransferase